MPTWKQQSNGATGNSSAPAPHTTIACLWYQSNSLAIKCFSWAAVRRARTHLLVIIGNSPGVGAHRSVAMEDPSFPPWLLGPIRTMLALSTRRVSQLSGLSDSQTWCRCRESNPGLSNRRREGTGHDRMSPRTSHRWLLSDMPSMLKGGTSALACSQAPWGPIPGPLGSCLALLGNWIH